MRERGVLGCTCNRFSRTMMHALGSDPTGFDAIGASSSVKPEFNGSSPFLAFASRISR
jgi:hypothetical protein